MDIFTSSQQTNNSNITARIQPWLRVLTVLVVLFCAYQTAQAVYVSRTTGILAVSSPDTSITITVSQKDRQTVNLAGKSTQRIRLAPGTYNIIASKDKNQTISSVIILKKQLVNFTAKTPIDKNKPSESTKQANKLTELLPFTGPGFEYRVAYSYKFNDTRAEPTIVITAPTELAKQDALTWIKKQGYDTLTLPIEFVTAQL